MPTPDEIRTARAQLETWRRSLEAPFAAAQAAGDQAEMERLQGIAADIDAVLDELAFLGLAQIAASLAEIRGRIEKKKKKADEAAESLASASLSKIRKMMRELTAQTAEEAVPEEPAPPPPPAIAAEPLAPVAAPETAGDGRLVLGEAAMRVLWARSQFPVSPGAITLFGLRGCRPVDFAAAGMAAEQEIALSPVNYRTMNCTLGHWRPGEGVALFPGSTVPFGAIVEAKIAAGGVGVNQMGCGRYTRYVAGWHKRSEGPAGHWALLQSCQITLQRTADDADFDLHDRWEAGKIAGDNIHCAFHMGLGEGVADVEYSSAGCQVVAGTVKKGERGSEQGPWRRFIEPFHDRLGAQKSAEYVLFNAEEAQQAIRTLYRGKTIILRMGSAGPWVWTLQEALHAREGAGVSVDGDFGAETFLAVVDFQTRRFGVGGADGVVGGETARALGLTLPAFDPDEALAGGAGAPAAAAGARIAWGAVTEKKHGPRFKARVVEMAARLGADPNNLMAVMAFETGESFDPAEKNRAGSGATGLIQFMPETASGLGASIAALEAMTGVEQLEFVEKHFRSVAGGRGLPTLSDVYMAVLWPRAIGASESAVLFEKPSKAYDQNKGLDVNKNGRITKAEATKKVQDKLVLGLKEGRVG